MGRERLGTAPLLFLYVCMCGVQVLFFFFFWNTWKLPIAWWLTPKYSPESEGLLVTTIPFITPEGVNGRLVLASMQCTFHFPSRPYNIFCSCSLGLPKPGSNRHMWCFCLKCLFIINSSTLFLLHLVIFVKRTAQSSCHQVSHSLNLSDCVL